jgi:prepilin-type N-terminal cleavage/methylation domain-containing protein
VKRNDRGFTLVEMMIAVAISAMLVGGIYAALVSSQRTAGALALDEARDAARMRAVELIRSDLRARLKIKAEPGSGESCTMILSTTSDGLALGAMKRSVEEVRYTASPKGLKRVEEQGAETELATGPVILEFWENGAWRKQSGPGPVAVRVIFSDPTERVVIR